MFVILGDQFSFSGKFELGTFTRHKALHHYVTSKRYLMEQYITIENAWLPCLIKKYTQGHRSSGGGGAGWVGGSMSWEFVSVDSNETE